MKLKMKPEYKTLKLKVDPCQGVAALAVSIFPPGGYAFHSIERKDSDAVITFVKEAEVIKQKKNPLSSLQSHELAYIELGLNHSWAEASADLAIIRQKQFVYFSRKAVMEIAVDRFQEHCGYPREEAKKIASILHGLSDNALRELAKKVFPAGRYLL